MALGKSTRDQVFLDDSGVPSTNVQPFIASDHRGLITYPLPNVDASLGSKGIPNFYIPINPEIAKAYVINPTNQGQRGGVAARQSMMNDPRNSPSRSQKSEGYTVPIQQFGAQITWETPSGQHTAGKLPTQPSTKLASPFSTSSPIATRMPWDV